MPATPPLSGNEVHDFGSGIYYNTVAFDTPFLFTLQWSDPIGGSANDYDLYLGTRSLAERGLGRLHQRPKRQ